MTVLEQRYMETVLRHLPELVEELKKLNKNLMQNGKDDAGTPSRAA